jgi:hypothetical protein
MTMIGKAEWFKQRKYSGWGIMPKTWQGYVYLAAILVPIAVFQALPFWSAQVRAYVTIGWAALIALDVFHIMATLKRDEREYKIEAMSERNAAWAMILAIVIGVAYQTITSGIKESFSVDIFLIIALVAGMAAKAISNLAYERKAL